MMPHKFDAAITECREAHRWCRVLTLEAQGSLVEH